MDLTSPFNFELAAMQLIYTPQGVVFAEKIAKAHKLLANTNFPNQELANNLAKGSQSAWQLVCKNGNSIIVGPESKVYTQSGWKEVSELTPKDYILHRIVLPCNQNDGGRIINYNQELKTSSMPIYVPKKMSETFAEWLGIFYALGEFNQHDGRISIFSNDDTVVNEYINLTEQVFKLKPLLLKDKRPNRQSEYYFISQNITRFLSLNSGRRHLKKIPQFLLEGSNDEHLAFLAGLAASPKFYNEKYLVMYQGDSKMLADFVSLVLRNNGYIATQVKADNSNNNKNDYYTVMITGKHPKAIAIKLFHQELEQHLNKPLEVLVDISEQFSSLKIPSYHKHYETYRRLLKSEHKICSWSIAESLGINLSQNEHYLVGVSKVKVLNSLKQVNLKVLYTEGLLVNNIVLSGHY